MVQKPKAKDVRASDLVGDFKRLGFTDYEAKIYMQLLTQAPATAYEVAKASGVPRPNTYNALDSLAKRGAVQPISENPVRYVATPPDRHLAHLGRETMALCETLTRDLARIETVDSDPYVWNVQGELAIHRKIASMVDEAQSYVWIKASSEVLRPHAASLQQTAARGVNLLIVLWGKDADEFRYGPTCKVFLHEGNGVRMGTADNLFTLTVDHVEALTATTDKSTAFHTRNHAVVQMADTLIRHDYYMAEIHARFGTVIDEAFGPHLRDLRLHAFSPDQVRSFRTKTGIVDGSP